MEYNKLHEDGSFEGTQMEDRWLPPDRGKIVYIINLHGGKIITPQFPNGQTFKTPCEVEFACPDEQILGFNINMKHIFDICNGTAQTHDHKFPNQDLTEYMISSHNDITNPRPDMGIYICDHITSEIPIFRRLVNGYNVEISETLSSLLLKITLWHNDSRFRNLKFRVVAYICRGGNFADSEIYNASEQQGLIEDITEKLSQLNVTDYSGMVFGGRKLKNKSKKRKNKISKKIKNKNRKSKKN